MLPDGLNPPHGPLAPPAHLVARNLDTGEDVSLEPSSQGGSITPDDEAMDIMGEEGGARHKKKLWLGTKKLTKWAKNTLHTLKDNLKDGSSGGGSRLHEQELAAAAAQLPPRPPATSPTTSYSALQQAPTSGPGATGVHSSSGMHRLSRDGRPSVVSASVGLLMSPGSGSMPEHNTTGMVASSGVGLASSTATSAAAYGGGRESSSGAGGGNSLGLGAYVTTAAGGAIAGLGSAPYEMHDRSSTGGIAGSHFLPEGATAVSHPAYSTEAGSPAASTSLVPLAAEVPLGSVAQSEAGSAALDGLPFMYQAQPTTPPKLLLNIPVKVYSKKGAVKQLNQVKLVQEINGHDGVVWVMRLSHDGKLLATAGQDGIIRIWSVVHYSKAATTVAPSDILGGDADEAGSSRFSDYGDTQAPPALYTINAPASATSTPAYRNVPPSTPNQPSLVSSASYNSTHSVAGGGVHSYGQPSHLNPTYHPLAAHTQHSLQPPQPIHSQSGLPTTPHHHHPASSALPPALRRFPVLREEPVLTLEGHTDDILDLCWSRAAFLLSASVDGTVRLWHLSEAEAVRVYTHGDMVTSVQFHPHDPMRFVTGAADGRVRVWNIIGSQAVASKTVHQDMITAVTFSLDGQRVVAGTLRGKAIFYECSAKKLEYLAQVDVRNQHGQAVGKKVTAVVPVPSAADQYLITSNDSRIRLYSGYAQECKYKGHKNANTRIAATFSPSGQHIICGSDDGWVYLWQSGVDELLEANQASQAPGAALSATSTKNRLFESFQTAEATSTVAIFAPDACRRKAIEDPYATSPNTQQSGLSTRGGVLGAPQVSLGSEQSAVVDNPLKAALFFVAGFSGRILVYENVS